MLGTIRRVLRSDKDTHFTGGLAQNASEDENIAIPGYSSAVLGSGAVRFFVREIRIISDQNLIWEVQLFAKDTFGTSDADTDSFLGAHQFAVADGVQNDGAGFFYYSAVGLDLFYHDADDTGEFHITLVNRSAGAKNAGATGEIVVELGLEAAH